MNFFFCILTLSQTSPGFYVSFYKSFENTRNTRGKREIARNEQFLYFPTVFPFGKLPAILIKIELVVCKLSVWERLILTFGKG